MLCRPWCGYRSSGKRRRKRNEKNAESAERFALVPLPLPGAPKRMKVLYFMSEIRLYRKANCLDKHISRPKFSGPWIPRCATESSTSLPGSDAKLHDRIDVDPAARAIEAHLPSTSAKMV